jgi:hypothetical protein
MKEAKGKWARAEVADGSEKIKTHQKRTQFMRRLRSSYHVLF